MLYWVCLQPQQPRVSEATCVLHLACPLSTLPYPWPGHPQSRLDGFRPKAGEAFFSGELSRIKSGDGSLE
jgi:hypothetical protein